MSTVLGGVALPVGNPKNNRIENNIFVSSSGNQLDLRMSGENNRFTRNIIFYADPLFVDAASGNYRLRPVSPAFSLGFQPIPIDKIGLTTRLLPSSSQ